MWVIVLLFVVHSFLTVGYTNSLNPCSIWGQQEIHMLLYMHCLIWEMPHQCSASVDSSTLAVYSYSIASRASDTRLIKRDLTRYYSQQTDLLWLSILVLKWEKLGYSRQAHWLTSAYDNALYKLICLVMLVNSMYHCLSNFPFSKSSISVFTVWCDHLWCKIEKK